jgi:probable F420-dependent oxidoreductase
VEGREIERVKLGTVLPRHMAGEDPAALKTFVQRAEALGFSHISSYEHVLGARPAAGAAQNPSWAWEDPFFEPLVAFAYMAAITEKIEFATCILVLPQRNAAVVAKQVAQLAVVSRGRFRLGVGAGWNRAEFGALGANWSARGAILEEQIYVLRRLWADPTVNFRGEFHQIRGLGINPRPTQAIPIWIGGGITETSLDRIVRCADGWMLPMQPSALEAAPKIRDFRNRLQAAGRDPGSVGLEATMPACPGGQFLEEIGLWRELGPTHLSLDTQEVAGRDIDAHLALLQQFRDAVAR